MAVKLESGIDENADGVLQDAKRFNDLFATAPMVQQRMRVKMVVRFQCVKRLRARRELRAWWD